MSQPFWRGGRPDRWKEKLSDCIYYKYKGISENNSKGFAREMKHLSDWLETRNSIKCDTCALVTLRHPPVPIPVWNMN